MSTTTKFRLRLHNGMDYDIYHPETEAGAVIVQEEYTNPLNTDQLTLGMNTVYFTEYPYFRWCVDHLDGDYAYLGLYDAGEKTEFGSNTTYSGSTIASKCTTFLNNTIPNVADYLENVTVNGVTNKVFIPSYKMFSGTASSGGGDANDPTFDWPSASAANRAACVYIWNNIGLNLWLSSSTSSNTVWYVTKDGGIFSIPPTFSYGFRPEVKVRYKTSPDTLDNVLNDFNNRIINGGTSAPTTQPVGGLWFETLDVDDASASAIAAAIGGSY